eukprot:gene2339-2807_t
MDELDRLVFILKFNKFNNDKNAMKVLELLSETPESQIPLETFEVSEDTWYTPALFRIFFVLKIEIENGILKFNGNKEIKKKLKKNISEKLEVKNIFDQCDFTDGYTFMFAGDLAFHKKCCSNVDKTKTLEGAMGFYLESMKYFDHFSWEYTQLLIKIGNCCNLLGKTSEGYNYFEKTKEKANQIEFIFGKDASNIILSIGLLGQSFSNNCPVLCNMALELFQIIPNCTNRISNCHFHLALIFESLGNYTTALDHLFRSLTEENKADIYFMIGKLYLKLGNDILADKYFIIATKITQINKNLMELTANILEQRAALYYRYEDYENGLIALVTSKSIYQDLDNPLYIISPIFYDGIFSIHLGDWKNAEILFKKILYIFEQYPCGLQYQYQAVIGLAISMEKQNELNMSLKYFLEALSLLSNKLEQQRVFVDIGRIYFKLEDYENSLEYLNKINLSDFLVPRKNQIQLNDLFYDNFALKLEIYSKCKDKSLQVLKDNIGTAMFSNLGNTAMRGLCVIYRINYIDGLENKNLMIWVVKNNEVLDFIIIKMPVDKTVAEEKAKKAMNAFRRVKELSLNNYDFWTFDKLNKKKLYSSSNSTKNYASDSNIDEFSIQAENVLGLVDKDYKKKYWQEFNEKTKIDELENYPITKTNELYEHLYEFLLSPIEKYFKQEKCISILPHESICNVPFSALKKKNSNEFLIDIVPKIHLIPNFNIDILVNKYLDQKKKSIRFLLIGVDNLKDMENGNIFCEKEVDEIEKILLQKYSKDQIVSIKGKDCTKPKILKKIVEEPWTVIHFSCHSKNHSSKNSKSSGVMQLFQENLESDEHLFNSDELEENGIELSDTQLVCLSSCESSLGTFTLSEGNIGFMYQLQKIGVTNVIGSLWSVDSATTLKFMKNFYEKLTIEVKGSIPNSLNYSMKKIRSDKSIKYLSTYHWAPFVYQGVDYE